MPLKETIVLYKVTISSLLYDVILVEVETQYSTFIQITAME